MDSLQHYKKWLPGELLYSARKVPYHKKLERAKKEIDDGQSTHTFLGTEWHHAKLARWQGFYHVNEHAKSAQLQYAKFAAGIFDKVALIDWQLDGSSLSSERQGQIAHSAAHEMTNLLDRDIQTVEIEALDLAFNDTTFSPAIVEFQRAVSCYDGLDDTSLLQVRNELLIPQGVKAVGCYLVFASYHLTNDQLTLPESQLAD